MSRVRTYIDGLSGWWAGYFAGSAKRIGMTGRDGNLSHTKVFGYAVLGAYLLNASLPASVAMTLIISAHGTKALIEAIHSGVFSAKATDATNLNITRSKTEITTHNIDERIGWDTAGEFQAS